MEIWFRKIGENVVSSLASRMTQGIFVGHHDRKGAVLCIAQNGVVRGKSWTRQPLNDAWDATNWDGLCGTLWQMVASKLKLKKKVTHDNEGAGPHCQGLQLKEFQRKSQEDSTCCRPTSRFTVEVVRVVLRLHRTEERQNHARTMSRTNQNDDRETFDGKCKDQCI